MNIDGVNNGIVLDHIRAGTGIVIYNYLSLEKQDCCVALIQNVKSGKYGKKDIIKIDSDIEPDLDMLGYLDPNITVNYIRDGKLLKKSHLELPKELHNILKCKNPRCITATEPEAEQIFVLTDRKNRIYRCAYCEEQ
ncbi:MAG TPA: aspartate carbamoyltransferase regulatory subunit [Bacillota bacterium]|nr:aspartate carbamoyltransferase regulatory subunit [Bacillota bacterium]